MHITATTQSNLPDALEVKREAFGTEDEADVTRQLLAKARKSGVRLVFVLGIPEYYPRHGFQAPAEARGFEPPYPLAEGDEQAWMVQELSPGFIGQVNGRVVAADAFMRPEYWRE